MRHRFLQSMVLKLVVCVLVLAASLAHSVPAATAQGGTLSYGALAYGTISPDAPLLLYSFSGTQSDLVQINLEGVSGGLLPFLDLLGPDRQPVASAGRAPFTPDPAALQLALYLPETGLYSLMIGSVENTSGDFLLELNGHAAPAATPLTLGQPVPVDVPANAAAQHFSFTAEATCPTALTVLNPSEGTPYTFPYIVKIRDERAQQVALLRGGDALQNRVTVPAQSGTYAVEVWADDPALTGSLTLRVDCAGDPQECVSAASLAGADGGLGDVCPECPPCPGDSLPDDPLCGAFSVTASGGEDGVITLNWPAIEGANAAIIAASAADGELVYARMVVDTLTDAIVFPALGVAPGTYTVRVTVGAEDAGYSLCADTIAVEYESLGPVEWGPAVDDEECMVSIVAPLDTMANGLQTFFWTDVPGAESYRLRIYGEFDNTVADGAISAPATSMTLDVSEAAIGVGYGGGNEFYAQINAYREGASWCSSGVRLARTP